MILISFILLTLINLIVITGDDAVDAEKPPIISKWQPEEFFLPEGSTFQLKCPIVSTVFDTKVKWYRDDALLLSNSDSQLAFNYLTPQNSGVYRCLATNEIGSFLSLPLNITALYLYGFAENFERTYEASISDSLVLKPPPIIASTNLNLTWKWYFNGEKVLVDSNLYIALNGDLVLTSLTHKSFGSYKVSVSADKSNEYTSSEQTVAENDDDDSEIKEAEAEDFIYSSRDTIYRTNNEGEVTLECVPSNRIPLNRIKWSINDVEVVDSDLVTISHSRRRLSLRRPERYLTVDGDVVRVKCSDLYRETASSYATIQIFRPPNIDRDSLPVEITKTVGDSINVECHSNGVLKPTVQWYFNGHRLGVNGSVLVIDQLDVYNFGVYQCEAKNAAGIDMQIMWLRSVSDALKTMHNSAKIVLAPEDVVIAAMKDLVLRCQVIGNPFPTVTWNHNGSIISQSLKYVINEHSITIKSLFSSDSGKYTCVAKNDQGYDEKSAFVSVIEYDFIEVGPKNSSVVVGSKVIIPCNVSDKISNDADISVTWKWKGRLIPEDGYPLHRLQITNNNNLLITQAGPDNIGIYTCTVSDGVSEQSLSGWLNIIDKPYTPQWVTAKLYNNTIPPRVRVSWTADSDGSLPIINYHIEMRNLGPMDQWSQWLPIVGFVPFDQCCEAAFDNLKPASIHQFRVIAENRLGRGKPSSPSINFSMPVQLAAAPLNVAASARSWSSVMVQWQPPPSKHWSDDILGYVVRYRLAYFANLDWIYLNISNSYARNTPLEQLMAWREYEIQVAAYGSRGIGVFTKPVYVSTLEGVPIQAPRDVKVTAINSTAISVSFVPPLSSMIPGVNQGYKIELWKGPVSHEYSYRQVRVLPNENLFEVIGSLGRFGHYNVTVLCFTAPGDGPRSKSIEVTTFEDVPGPVENIRFDMILFNMVTIIWNPPVEPNGIIIKYTISYWKSSLPDEKISINTGPDSRNVTIDGLTASTSYAIDIQASTKIGDGPKVEAKFDSGKPPELPERPSSLIVSNITKRTVLLEFVPGLDGHAFIQKWIVEAKIGASTLYTPISSVSAPKAHSIVVQGLRPFTKYRLRLIAENVRGRSSPSQPSKEFSTLEAEPIFESDRFFPEPTSSSSINVNWTPLSLSQWNGIPRSYIIMYRIAENDLYEQWNEVRVSNVKAANFILTDLSPYTVYELKMAAENSFGRSESSKALNVTTYEAPPSTSPEHIYSHFDKKHGVNVSWSPVAAHMANGKILGYQIRLLPKDEKLQSEYSAMKLTERDDLLHVYIPNLRPYTTYKVFVVAYNIIGYGPEDSAHVIETPQDLPGEPTNVSFSYISENEVRPKWNPPHEPNGEVVQYGVTYWKFGSKDNPTTTSLPPYIFGFSATGLQPFSKYIFRINARTAVGWGPSSQVIVLTTSQRTPPPVAPTPVIDRSVEAKPRELTLTWTMTSSDSYISPIRFIQIQYQAEGDDWITSPVFLPGIRNATTITGLKPNTNYRMRLKFSCDFDESNWSYESEWMKTSEDSPSAPPTAVQGVPYEASSVLLKWIAPSKNAWCSESIGFRILYAEYPSNDSFKSVEIFDPVDEDDSKKQYVLRKLPSFRHYIFKMQAVNQKGSSPMSTPVFVYVGYSIPKRPVENLSADAVSSTSIRAQWNEWIEDPNDIITGFKVRCTPLLPALTGAEGLEEVVIAENNSIIISDLRKYTLYQITVLAFNRAGEGLLSSTRVQTLEDRPGPISNLTFTDILLDSINVSWSLPNEPNGELRGYIINYRTYKLKEEFKKEIQEKTTKNYFLATNLEENVTYYFSVRAETVVGSGDEVAASISTGPNLGCPGSPSRPTVVSRHLTFKLAWAYRDPGKFPIKGYVIQAKRTAHATESNSSSNVLADSTRRSRRTPHKPDVAHIIGEWITLVNSVDVHPVYEINYVKLQPASLYVFRVFARNLVGIGHPSEESSQLYVPASLPEEPFYAKLWFVLLIAMSTIVVIVVVISVLCVTGNKYKYQKRTSNDSLQLSDGGIASYELRTSKRKDGKQNQRQEQENLRQHMNTSWLSNCRNPPIYGSMTGADTIGMRMYGVLATDTMPANTYGDFNPPITDYNRSLHNFANHDRLSDNFMINDEELNNDQNRNNNDRGNLNQEPSIAQHYDHEDIYRNTWRRARAEALAGASSPSIAATPLRMSRPTSSESGHSELMTVASVRTKSGTTSNGFSSFV